MARGIIFNGTNQNAKVTLPNSSPFNNLSAFKIVFKARNFSQQGYFFYILGKQSVYINSGGSPSRLDWTEAGTSDMFLPPTTYSDVIGKIQFDPANSRWTFETWNTDGTGRVERFVNISNVANRNYGGAELIFASNEWNVSMGAFKLDWWYMQSGVEALGVFPGTEATTSATVLKYTFDSDNGQDTSGNNVHLALSGTPTFEDTPGSGGGGGTTLALDTFTDVDNTNLQSHTGENGLIWTRHANGSNNAIIANNKLTKDSQTGAALYYANVNTPDNCFVEATIGMLTSLNVNAGLVARLNPTTDNYYLVRHNQATQEWQLRKAVNTTATTIASWPDTLSPGVSRLVRFELNSTSLKIFIDGVERISATDSSHTTGKSGIRFSGGASTTTGYFTDGFQSDAFNTIPNAPSNLTLSAASPTQVNLSWADNSSNETSFRVERKTGSGGTYSEIGSTSANVTSFSDPSTSANTTYFYRVKSRNSIGDSLYLTEQSVTTPVTGAPAPPSGLSLNAVSPTRIDLSWTDNSTNETLFAVERKTGVSGTYSEITTVGANVVTYSDTTVSAGLTYFYRVRARNASGNSAYTAEQSITTSAAGPNAPSGLVLTGISGHKVKLVWTDNSSDETSFRIERKTGANGTYAEIASVVANVTTYIDKTVTVNTLYYYRVRTANANGFSAYLTEQFITTPNTVSIFQANLQHGQGTDGVFNYARQLNALLPGTDVVCVQERGTSDTSWNFGLSAAGFTEAVYLENSSSQQDGPAIWYKPASVTLHATYSQKLSTGAIGWDGSTNVDKAAVGVRVTVAGQPFYIFCTHLAWSAGADSNGSTFSTIRVAQIKTLLNWINSIVGTDPNYIIVGDLNFGPDYPREQTFTVDASTDTITSTNHGWKNGVTVTVRNTGGALPGGLTASTTYFVRDATTNTLKLATTANGAAVNITSSGSGSNYLVGLQMDLFSAQDDLWLRGIANGTATAVWGDRNGDGQPDMPITNLTTRTHDTRRIDYALLNKQANNLALRGIDIPDLRAVCPHGLISGACTPDVTQTWGTADDAGVRPSDHNWTEVVLNTQAINSSSGNINFVTGPQIPIGTDWFSTTQTSRAIVFGDSCPAVPPTDFAGLDQFVLLQYYDLPLNEYNTYLRTGNPIYKGYFDKASSSWWQHPFWIQQGAQRDFDNGQGPPPRHAGIAGLILRALDGHSEMWDWINAYTRYSLNNWVKNRINNAKLYYGLREGAFSLNFAALLAKVLPDSFPLQSGGTETNGAGLRAQYLADIENVIVNYFGRLQYPDGSWRWDTAPDEFVDIDGGTLLNIMEPFMVGLYLTALIDIDQLPISSAVRTSVRNQLTSACEHLFYEGPYRTQPITTWSGKTWRSFWYFYHGGTTVNPTKYENGGGSYDDSSVITEGQWVVSSERQGIAILFPAYSYAWKITGNTIFRDAFDELVDAAFTGTDGIRNLMDGTAKNLNQNTRRGGSGFYWRQFSASNSAPLVDAGTNKVLSAGTTNTALAGTASDADGDMLTTTWSVVSGPNTPTITSPSSLNTNVNGLVSGTYVFRLTASDGINPSVFDEIQVIVGTVNLPPVVNAGADKNLVETATTTTLTGTASDPEGVSLSLAWSQLSGPSTATIVTPTTSSTNITGLIPGVYVLRLTANDGTNSAVSDDVTVRINSAPLVNAGTNQNLNIGVTSTTLTGTVTDTDGDTVAITWSLVSGPNTPTIVSPSSLTTNVTGLIPGTYLFKLSGNDGVNPVVINHVQVIVNGNQIPIVNAGNDKNLVATTTSTSLTATASDPDGGAVTVLWTMASGPNTPTIVSPTNLTTSVTGLVPGIYVFRCTATDNEGTSAFDDIVVKVNRLPVVNAGIDQTLLINATSTTLIGTASDSDGDTLTSTWTIVSGPNTPTINSPNTLLTVISNLITGTYVFRLSVSDGTNPTVTDDVQVIIPAPPVQPISVNAGNDVRLPFKITTATLTGNASGTISNVTWSVVSGPNVPTITSPNSLTTNINNLLRGTYVFRLSVNNGAASDDITIIVPRSRGTMGGSVTGGGVGGTVIGR